MQPGWVSDAGVERDGSSPGKRLGNTETLLAEEGFIADPPRLRLHRRGGADPAVTLPTAVSEASGRQIPSVPDVSWMPILYRVAILITVPDAVPLQQWQIWEERAWRVAVFGTLAIANQEAKLEAQDRWARRTLSLQLPAGAIYDVVPQKSKHNVTASIQEPGSPTSTRRLKCWGDGPFISAIWTMLLRRHRAGDYFGTDRAETKKAGQHHRSGTPNCASVRRFLLRT